MNIAELKLAAEQLSDDERLELAAFIRWLFQRDNAEWQAELALRLDRCLSGHGRSAIELESLHDRLSRDGR